MTVYELIQQLQDCDMPDAEVRMGAKWHQPDGLVLGETVALTEVSVYDADGPVCLEGLT